MFKMAPADPWLTSQYLSAETKDLEVVLESAGNPSLLSVFPAHILVLRSQSSVLTAMLNSSRADSGKPIRFRIKDNVSPRTVEYFLRFIYLRNLPKLVHFQNLCELLTMADTYEISELFSECKKRLKNSIIVENVCELYEIASTLNVRELVEGCRDFISANCQAILGNDLHFALLGEQRLMQVLCKTPKTLARHHEWNKKTKEGEFQRSAVLRWKTWICCVRGVNHSDGLDTALEIQAVDQEVTPYVGKSDPANWIPELFMDTTLCDIELLVDGGAKFPVHGLVLIKQSEVFLNMWNETKSNVDLNKCTVLQIELKDINARTTEYMLRFLYTQELPSQILDTNLVSLLSCAHRFELSSLESKCLQMLQKKVNLTNCCQIFELAERLDIKSLSDFCNKKILDNVEKILHSQLHFSLSKQTLVKLLTGMKAVEVGQEWIKWRCCLLGVSPDVEEVSKLTQDLLSEASISSEWKKNDKERSKRNSAPKMLFFSASDKELEVKQEDK